MILYIAVVLVFFTIAIILYLKQANEYFPKKGIKTLTTYMPIFGHAFNLVARREHFTDYLKRMYEAYPHEKYYGMRHFSQKIVLVKDVEIIKQIGVKDFDYFMDRFAQIDDKIDKLFGSNLVALKGQKWRDMRATLSPAFTTSKMRGMFQFITQCGDQMAKYYLKTAQKPENKGHMEIEVKDVFTRYTTDVIATCAFGIKINSLQDRENEFYTMGKESMRFTGMRLMKIFAIVALPRIMKLLNVSVLSKKVNQFFRDLVGNTIKHREEKGIIRPDMIHLLMQAKKGSLKHDTNKSEDEKETGFSTVNESDLGKHTSGKGEWEDDEIVAQAIIFFIAGFETSANLLSFMAYELAKNTDIQTRLQEEIDEVAGRNNGNVKYEDLPKMKYMDMVVSETLRYWPPASRIDRKCVKDYELPPSNKSDARGGKLSPGDGLWIPIYCIHRDPQYYKNPDKFDPERFSDENKHEINPLAYLPFGLGPRNCIGSRFALMQVKAVAFHMLKYFSFTVIDKTPIPFVFSTKSPLSVTPSDGLWIGLTPRKDSASFE